MFKKLEFETLDIVSSFVLGASNFKPKMITFPKPQLNRIFRKAYNAVYWLLLFNLIAFGWSGRALAASGDGLFSYGSVTGGSSGQKYRTWTPSSYGGETSGPVSSVTTNWTVMKGSPVNIGVYVQAFITTEASNNLKVYSGTTAQTSEWTATVSSTQYAYRAVDLAFENTSGNVLVVYLTSADTDTIYYQEGSWNGTDYDWSASSFTDATIGNFRHLRLANKLNDDDMIVAATGDNGTDQVNAWVWDGSSFGNEMGANGTVNGTQDNMDAAWETSTGDGLVAWGVATGVDSASWSGGSWTSNAITSTNASPVINTAIAADPASASDDIVVGAIEDQAGDDVWGKIWGGSSWVQDTQLDTSTASTSGRGIDVAYAGTTGNAILVYADSSGSTLDWARSTGVGAFAVQTDYDPTPTFGLEHIIALVPDASGSNVIMDNFVDANSDLFGFYYDDDAPGGVYWFDPAGAALEADSSGGLIYESFQFGWESVYKVPTLTEILFLILVGAAVFLGIKTGVIKIKKNNSFNPKDIQNPPNKNIPSIETLGSDNKQILHNRQGHPSPSTFAKASVDKRLRVTRSIDGITRREIKN